MIAEHKICLITSTHVVANPRLVKEADALVAAGYGVFVIAADVNHGLRKLDQHILTRARWNYRLVDRGSLLVYALQTLAQRIARFVLGTFRSANLSLASVAHHRLTRRLAQAASRVRADLYIAHNLAALPAAAQAAKRSKTQYAFDAEDFHTEELMETQRNAGDQIAREMIERHLLPGCSYRTGSSPLICEAYRRKYGVEMSTILNVFPLAEAASRVSIEDRLPRSLYWFSQTIGTGRGIEAIVLAMKQMARSTTLYLQGTPAAGYERELRSFAVLNGLGDRLHFLPPVAPCDLASQSARYAIGLALELNEPRNRELCLTNKAFTYLLAGLPILLSRTPAQEALAAEMGDAAILVNMENPQEIAEALDCFFADSARQERARVDAWRLGRERYNWDNEKKHFLNAVASALGDNEHTVAQ